MWLVSCTDWETKIGVYKTIFTVVQKTNLCKISQIKLMVNIFIADKLIVNKNSNNLKYSRLNSRIKYFKNEFSRPFSKKKINFCVI